MPTSTAEKQNLIKRAYLALLDRAAVTRMHPLIQLRWIAVMGQVATILFAHFVLEIDLPLKPMAVVLAILVAFNLFSMLRWRNRDEVSNESLFFSLLVDVFTLTAQLHYSGGVANPFVFLYLLQVVLAAALLSPWASRSIAGITGICFVVQILWASPVEIPQQYSVAGLLICFLLNAALIVVFTNRINRILREHDEHLSGLRQRAAEEEHIIRMGLLASGAAHELGTPLATISVLLGDWRRTTQFKQDDALMEDAAEMQIQIDRCKAIVSGILMSAGEVRAESPQQTTLIGFFDTLVASWCATRPVVEFDYRNTIEHDPLIVSDEGLKQMISNVLDNALEASPDWVSLETMVSGDDLIIRVLDNGPGFAPAMLKHFGRPYNSSKGKPGGGLGLFLSLNVARALGGNIFPQNRYPQGAVVTMVLPLEALELNEEAAHD